MTALATATRREHPLIMTDEMVRAIISGTKTQTRRLIQPGRSQRAWLRPEVLDAVVAIEPSEAGGGWHTMRTEGGHIGSVRCPYGEPNHRLWVKEAWAGNGDDATWYRASLDSMAQRNFKWRPSLYMPRSAARLLLEVTKVRAERLQALSTVDALAEGIIHTNSGATPYGMLGAPESWADDPRASYRAIWDRIQGPRGRAWASNPWVWVIEFRVVSERG